jgi:hypothetical protein
MSTPSIADYFETCEPAYPWGERYQLHAAAAAAYSHVLQGSRAEVEAVLKGLTPQQREQVKTAAAVLAALAGEVSS